MLAQEGYVDKSKAFVAAEEAKRQRMLLEEAQTRLGMRRIGA